MYVAAFPCSCIAGHLVDRLTDWRAVCQGPCEFWIGGSLAFIDFNCRRFFGGKPAQWPMNFSACKGSCLVHMYALTLEKDAWPATGTCCGDRLPSSQRRHALTPFHRGVRTAQCSTSPFVVVSTEHVTSLLRPWQLPTAITKCVMQPAAAAQRRHRAAAATKFQVRASALMLPPRQPAKLSL